MLVCSYIGYASANDADPAVSLNQITKNIANIGGIAPVRRDNESFVYGQWGLSEEEWKAYQLIRQGPIGVLNPNMDPLLALAMGAKSASEMQGFVERYIHIRHKLTEQMLAVSRVYHDRFSELYPGPVIDTRKMDLPEDSVWPSDSFVLVTKSYCTECIQKAQTAMRLTRSFAGNQFDIYVQDLREENDLLAWASKVIEKEDLESGRVTVNPGNFYLEGAISDQDPITLMVRRDDRLILVPSVNDLALK